MISFAVFGALLAMCAVAVFFAGRDGGVNAAKRRDAEVTAKAAKRIADARADAPSTRNDLVERLRDGGGL